MSFKDWFVVHLGVWAEAVRHDQRKSSYKVDSAFWEFGLMA
jgi:hypothetical protein